MSRDTRLDEASPEALLVEFEIRYQAAASAIRKRLRAASLSVSPVPPDCAKCGHPRSEHHVGQGWCLHGDLAEDATVYEPRIAEELAKQLAPAAVSPVPEPSEKKKIFIVCQPAQGWGANDVVGTALTEDGEVAASHFSSSRSFSRHDMGITSDWHHEQYQRAYPQGYELVDLTDLNDEQLANHTGYKAAYARSRAPVAHPEPPSEPRLTPEQARQIVIRLGELSPKDQRLPEMLALRAIAARSISGDTPK